MQLPGIYTNLHLLMKKLFCSIYRDKFCETALVSGGTDGVYMSIQTSRKQREYTERILFDYYMVSSTREDMIHSRFPFYLEETVYMDMVHSAQVLDRLVRRIIQRTLEMRDVPYFQYGEFPMHQEVKQLQLPLPPFFWVRYDAFQREEQGIFFSEFNYDKPCAQREIAIAGEFPLPGNPNEDFSGQFGKAFTELWKQYGSGCKNPFVAVLVDPGHYEEVHLAFLYADLLKPSGFDVMTVGGSNLEVKGDAVYAFGRKVDIILRQFPTEHLYECADMEKVLELYQKGKVLMLNDPRVIFGQTKSLFAFLWDMVNGNDPFLKEEETQVIRKTIPKTSLYHSSRKEELIKSKDAYVVKAAYGRYSREVYIGTMYSDREWEELLQELDSSEKLHIIQEFCPIRKQNVMYYNGKHYEETQAMGNFGIYMTNGSFTGICVRWSQDYLSLDEVVWGSPVGVVEEPFYTVHLVEQDRKEKWNRINDMAAFEFGYTGGYTGACESFTLDALIIKQPRFEELKQASEKIWQVIEKTTELVRKNYRIFCPVLGIDDSLQELVAQELTAQTAFISRLDWCMDTGGNWRILEVNSETPAGLMESVVLNDIIHSELAAHFHNPNEKLVLLIREAFKNIVKDYEKVKHVENIGFVSCAFSEDWYDTQLVYELLKDFPYNFISGEISGLETRDGKLCLYGKPLDAVYRYYPLDWLANDPYFEGVTGTFMGSTPSINPPASFIPQSKAFFALMWELAGQGFYSRGEKDLIEKYVPRTTLSAKKMKDIDNYCIKPFFGREGQQITFSFSGEKTEQKNSVFQEWVDSQTLPLKLFTTVYSAQYAACPVVGTYMINSKFGGIYTRAGSRITDRQAVYIPTFTV